MAIFKETNTVLFPCLYFEDSRHASSYKELFKMQILDSDLKPTESNTLNSTQQ